MVGENGGSSFTGGTVVLYWAWGWWSAAWEYPWDRN